MTKIDLFFMVWALVLPVTSVLVWPTVQGTLPAYLLAVCSAPLALILNPQKSASLQKWLMVMICLFVALTTLSQLSLLAFPGVDLSDLRLVNAYDGQTVFRSSLFTQSLYLLMGMLTFVFVKTFYKPSWNKFLFTGAVALALYGLYEFGYFLVFGHNGDFLSNRVFDTGSTISRGSLFQTLTLSGWHIMRLKSLTGEPSMYAFTILPFWIYAIHQRKTVVQLLLLVTLLLTTSTTAVLGISLYVFLRLFYNKPLRRLVGGFWDKYLFWFLLLAGVGTVAAWPLVQGFVSEMIFAKLSLSNVSGVSRFTYFADSMRFYADAPLLNQLFGIGFGYIRSTDFFSTLLVNTGLVGFLLFTLLFAYPILYLKNDYVSTGLKIALIVIYVTMMVAVSEFSYLSIWLYLGIAYRALGQNRALPKKRVAL